MKFELIRKGNVYYTRIDGYETAIHKDPDEDVIAYVNKAFSIFDKLVNLHKEHVYKDNIEILKTVNL